MTVLPAIELSVCEFDSQPYLLTAIDRYTGKVVAAKSGSCINKVADSFDLLLIELGYLVYTEENIND